MALQRDERTDRGDGLEPEEFELAERDLVIALEALDTRAEVEILFVAVADVSDATVREVLKRLHTANVVTREAQGRGHAYALDRDLLEQWIEVAEQQAAIAGESSVER